MSNKHTIESAIWYEESSHNEFQPDACFCHGYDVANELIPNASWFDYLYLLISGNRPSESQSRLLEKLAVLLANPGIRDLSVQAAMNAGVGNAPEASVLVAALAGGSGQYLGAKEIAYCMSYFDKLELKPFCERVENSSKDSDIWPDLDHLPGFDEYSTQPSKFVSQCLVRLAAYSDGSCLKWLVQNRLQIEQYFGQPIALSTVIAAVFRDLALSGEQAQYLFLILRLPGAAAHAMEQKNLGWQKFPFFADTVKYEGESEPLELPDVDALIEGYVND
ncbi:citryl-CoA lyase [Aliikangiella marina]|uniref:Citryl-CoA lyase n=1 Tax=Aliikangiella marina TaxID=1712262 RepID=A0A545TIM0_9GAMM|nr:citryl-CoA lyase [Aliikangiella marina]TQV77058.1 citryl-CoA lyase [Aliikangiella marina]